MCEDCGEAYTTIQILLNTIEKLEEEKLAYMEALSEEMIRNKQLKYELHIARTSAILLKHSIDGGYD